ncbi:MAG: hypothetical protein ACMG50_02965 [Thermomonas sp.]
MSLSRYLAPAVLAASLGLAAIAAPAPAQAQSSNDLVRVLVNVADVAMRGNQPYYRYGNYDYNDRLIAQRDRYGRIVYYRNVPQAQYRNGPPYGNAYGYYQNRPSANHRNVKCNRNGKCKTTYYDSRYDRDDRHDRYDRYDPRDDRDGRDDRR